MAHRFLLSRHPPPPELTHEQQEAAAQHLQKIPNQGWQEIRVAQQEITAA